MIPDPCRVLIIDDDPGDIILLKRLLSKIEGQIVVVEPRSHDSLDAEIVEGQIDIVFLDYFLGQNTGLDVLAQIRDAGHTVPVIALSGHGSESIAVEAMKRGAQDYLVKDDLGTETLCRAIENAIERVRLKQSLAAHQRKLEKSHRELEQFAYIASHDLQAPLRKIAGFCQLLEKRYQGRLDEEADKFINHIVDSTAHMQELISDLLAYSRIGRQGGPPGPVDLDAIVSQVIDDLKPTLDATQGEIECAPLPNVQGDATLLRQLMQNLIENALKFRRDVPPQVRIESREDEEGYHLVVADNGVGIDEEFYERIFGVFQRLHGKDAYPGTGIGLGFCKKIVEHHGGEIWVESEVGQGSQFHIRLPNERALEGSAKP